MITDTFFFRNKNYPQETDTIDTLDFETMAEVIKGGVPYPMGALELDRAADF
jgi:hypothetical protein